MRIKGEKVARNYLIQTLHHCRRNLLFFTGAVLLPFNAPAFFSGERITSPQDTKSQTQISYSGSGLLGDADFLSRTYAFQHAQTLYKTDQNVFQATTRLSHWNFTPHPATHVPEHSPLPSLKSYQFGGQGAHLRSNSDLIWGSIHVQSPSDRPFHSMHETEIHSTISYSFKKNANSQWSLLVNYASRRSFLSGIPLPGFLYSYSPTPDFRLMLGVPVLSAFWRFHPRWSILYFGIAPWQSRAQLNYTLFGPFNLGLGAAFLQNHYLLAGRKDHREQLYYDERKMFFNLRGPLSQLLYLDLELGSQWRRRFFLSRRYNSSPAKPIVLGQAFYIAANLSARFSP